MNVGGCWVPELRNVSFELRNVSFEMRNVSLLRTCSSEARPSTSLSTMKVPRRMTERVKGEPFGEDGVCAPQK